MTNSRALIARFALPLAATALVLTACGSSTASDETEPAAATSAAAEVMESDESEPMESKESEVMESEESEPMDSTAAEPAAATSGAYISLAEYESSKDMYAASDVVLFFNASWCSTCKEARENLEADPAAIPAGLTIVKVDYDDSDELKQKYGVTVQHTFVQVDADGNELAKWNGSVTADEIAEQTA
jgi:thiol-disulfide isomerase/thioredoxin